MCAITFSSPPPATLCLLLLAVVAAPLLILPDISPHSISHTKVSYKNASICLLAWAPYQALLSFYSNEKKLVLFSFRGATRKGMFQNEERGGGGGGGGGQRTERAWIMFRRLIFTQSPCWAGGSPRGEGNGATEEQQTQNLGRHAKKNKNILCSMICGGNLLHYDFDKGSEPHSPTHKGEGVTLSPQNEIRGLSQTTWTRFWISRYDFKTGCDPPSWRIRVTPRWPSPLNEIRGQTQTSN